jgi:hypothetical protein
MENRTEHFDPLTELACLDHFNTLFSQKAEARASYPLSERDQDLLKVLASGNIDESNRPNVISLLSGNAKAMEFLAKLLKEDR